MSEGWIVFGICIVVVLGAAIPLLKGRDSGGAPPPPPKETLRDWRNGK
ncbi:MAG TPA: hypothetical protein VJ576_11010 [Rhodocyclaceae bacterium]|nr:hypothetical protein [Rhodocyclaceae bacterium]